jgi:hypothetical protein
VQVVEGNVQATCHAHLPEARSILDDPIAKASVGLSHDSFVKLDRKRIDGKDVQVVESIESCNSVDFVPQGNANGRVLEAAPAEGDTDMDLETLTAEQLREARPDLVETFSKPVPQMLQAPPVDVTARVTEAVTAATAELQTQLAAVTQALAVRETERLVATVVDASELSEAARARVRERFAGLALPAEGLVERVQETIAAEAAYMAAILKAAGIAPKITNQGAAGTTPETIREGYDAELRRKMTEMGYSAADADAMMKAR